MADLYAQKTVSINALIDRVWEVLTQPNFTQQWVGHFQPIFNALESDWKTGSQVAWKTAEGKVLVDGIVTYSEPPHTLAFSVHDVSDKFYNKQDKKNGIFYTLKTNDRQTILTVRQGDFSILDNAEKYWQVTVQSWDRALLIITELAEQP